ncbi:MAG: cell division protein FtsK [Flavobacteriales bacterium]|nr:cell division protein FtsK [Flavobacteriales bacterium]
MFRKKNKQQFNTFKSQPNEKKTSVKRDSKNQKQTSFKKLLSPINAFLEKDRNKYAIGLSCLLIASFLTFSFISYFFSWKVDQDKVETWTTTGFEIFSDEFDSKDAPKNFMGTIGAKVSNLFMNKGFGLFAFCIPFFLFFSGLKIAFNRQILPLRKTFWKILPLMIWGPTLLGFIFQSSNFNFGGAVGFQMNIWLNYIAGTWGVVFILVFFGFLISKFSFNLRIESLVIDFFQSKNDKKEELKTSEEENILNHQNTFKTVLPADEEKAQEENEKSEEQNNSNIQVENLEEDDSIESPEKSIIENTASELEVDNTEFDNKSIELELNSGDEAKKEDLSFEIEESTNEEELLTEEEINEKVKEFGEYDPTLDLSDYHFPNIDLLNKYDAGVKQTVDPEILEENKNNIVNTLKNYKIEIDSIKATIGPTITLYEIVPAPGVRISKIKNLEDDIALSLAALGIRIIAPIPGKGTIGIEVPNPNPDIVSMHTAISSKAFQEAKMELPLALGKTITNETFTIDLAKMPHLLMAGATGQGKSVGLNAILVSLLYRKHPSELKLVLVDPKKVELTLFNKVYRHFLAKLPDEEDAIITDTQKVVNTVNSLCIEMDERYELLKNAHCRNIKEYNAKFKQRKLNPEKGHRFLPYIVLVIDEFADLIMTAGKEIETPIARLAQLARAIGIHLIVATQRPSVNIITGTIKANFPARIAFRVTSKIDSRTILDAGGADQLIGRGDMLLSTGNDLIRIQCAFVDTPEVEKICEFIGEQRGYSDAHLLPEFNDPNGESNGANDIDIDDRDEKFEEAARIIVLHQQGSASLLQRKLKLGYNRAGRIVDQLEAAGIIGPFEGSKARQVLIPDEISLEQKLIDIAVKQID